MMEDGRGSAGSVRVGTVGQLMTLIDLHRRAEAGALRLRLNSVPYDASLLGKSIQLDPDNFQIGIAKGMENDVMVTQAACARLCESLQPVSRHLKFEISVPVDKEKVLVPRARLFDTYLGLPIPTELINEEELGDYLARNGIARIARPDLLDLYWKFLDIVERHDSELAMFLDDKRYRTLQDAISQAMDNGQMICAIGELCASHEEAYARAARRCRPDRADELDVIALPSEERVQVSVLALERCNRGCRHCSMVAKPSLADMSLGVLEQVVEKLDLDKKVVLTVGEPFCASQLPNIIRRLLGLEMETQVAQVTSGINFEFAKECARAKELAAFTEQMKRRMKFTLSVSDYPTYGQGRQANNEMRRRIQQDTLRFAIENRMEFGIITFLPPAQTMDDLVIPVLHRIDTTTQFDDVVSWNVQIRHGREGLVGGWAIANGASYTELDGPPNESLRGCFANRLRGNVQIGVTGNGDIIPGCCIPAATFTAICHIDDGDRQELKEKILAFERAWREIDSMRKESGTGRGNCLDCLALAQTLRDPVRCKKSIGPANYAKVMEGRNVLRECRRG